MVSANPPWSPVAPGPAVAALASAVQDAIVDNQDALVPLLKPKIQRSRSSKSHPLEGFCYDGSNALYWLLGAKPAGWKPERVKIRPTDTCSHWWLVHEASGIVLDATWEQFGPVCAVPYGAKRVRGCGFSVPGNVPTRLGRAIMGLVDPSLVQAAREEVAAMSSRRHRNGDQDLRELERAWRANTSRQSVDYDGMSRWFTAMRRVGREREAIDAFVRAFWDLSFGATPDGDFWLFIARLASETVLDVHAANLAAMAAQGIYPGAPTEVRYAGRDYVGHWVALRKDRNFVLRGTVEFTTGKKRHVKELNILADLPIETLSLWRALGGRTGHAR